MLTPLSLVDLLAIIPFYLPMLITLDLRFIRAIRLFRIFRLFKIARYAKALKTFRAVILKKKEQLISTLFIISVLIVVSSSILYTLEHEAQPEAFSSIPHSMWWAVVTLTTVGYGDIYPITPAGKFVAAIILIFSIGLFAVPAGILASGFTQEEISDLREEKVCPHCGKKIN
jgi:voltage-gated potassium channel